MSPLRRLAPALCALSLAGLGPLAGCGSDLARGTQDGGQDAGGDAGTDAGTAAAISAPPNQWTWVDFPDSTCDDGSPTGIGINPGAASGNVLIYFNGGGACWDETTCLKLNTAVHGPFGAPQFQALISRAAGSILDRALAGSPVSDWTLVFVPYCTGDVHAGDNVAHYGATAYHHQGHPNVVAYLRRLQATLPAPGKVVVAGSSAGGYGALLNYDTFRAAWPQASAYLLDDAGPLLEGDSIPPGIRAAWFSAWNLGARTDPLCGTACRADASLWIPAVRARYPNDRMALLSSLQDQVIRSYLQLNAADFQTALLKLAADDYDPNAKLHVYFVAGQQHTFLGSPGSIAQNGQGLTGWLQQEIGDSAAWTSVKP